MKINGAQAIIEALIEEGVDTIFGYPGGGIMPFYDELYRNVDSINHILVRHERCASLLRCRRKDSALHHFRRRTS